MGKMRDRCGPPVLVKPVFFHRLPCRYPLVKVHIGFLKTTALKFSAVNYALGPSCSIPAKATNKKSLILENRGKFTCR